MKNAIQARADTAEVQQTHAALNQSELFPLSSTICNVTSHITRKKKPAPSVFTFFCLLAYGGSSRTELQIIAAIIPKGTFMKKIHGHVQLSVIQPPRTGPIIGASSTPSANIAIAAGRFSFGKLSSKTAWAIGIIPPPPMP